MKNVGKAGQSYENEAAREQTNRCVATSQCLQAAGGAPDLESLCWAAGSYSVCKMY